MFSLFTNEDGGGGSRLGVAPGRVSSRRVWDTGAFVNEFCGHIAGLSRDDIASCITHFSNALGFIQSEISSGGIDVDVGRRAQSTVASFAESISKRMVLYRKFSLFEMWGADYHLSRLVGDLTTEIRNMASGEMLLVPFGEGCAMLLEALENDDVSILIINTNPNTSYHKKTIIVERDDSKILQNTVMELTNVPRHRLISDAFWSFVFIAGKDQTTADELFYTHLTAWLTEKDFEGATAGALDHAMFATPAKGDSGFFWKSLVHALRHKLLTKAKLSYLEVKHIRHFIRQYFVNVLLNDLRDVSIITFATKKLVGFALDGLALSASRNYRTFSQDQLESTRRLMDQCTQRANSLTCKDESVTAEPPMLDVTNGWEQTQQPDTFPLFDVFRRIESVNAFAGAKAEEAKATPINFFRIPAEIRTIDEAISTINDAVLLFTRVQAHHLIAAIKNAPLLIACAIDHLFIEVLPQPVGPVSAKEGCVTLWSTRIRYAQQLLLLQRLEQLAEIYRWAQFSLDEHKDHDAMNMVVTASMATIADAVLRMPALDDVSLITEHLNGFDGAPAFGFGPGPLSQQTESVPFIYPEALLARAAILDYFDEMTKVVQASNLIWKWEEANPKEYGAEKLLRQIALCESFDPANALLYGTTTMEESTCFVERYYPEFAHLRNLVGFFKISMSSHGRACNEGKLGEFPGGIAVSKNGMKFSVTLEGRSLQMQQAVRFVSESTASGILTGNPDLPMTEDDLLHKESLVHFQHLGQRDAELLLSFLTTPYLRIPLVLRFLATEDRVSSLDEPAITEMLHGVLFEPAKFLPLSLSNLCPTEVPSENPALIATPYGLMIAELQHSPKGVVEPVLRLLQLVKEMDAGTVFNESVRKIIFQLLRAVVVMESYIVTVIDQQRKHTAMGTSEKDAASKVHERSFTAQPEDRQFLEDSYQNIRAMIGKELMPMLDSWEREVQSRVESDEVSIDAATMITCSIHYHQLLLLRNVRRCDYTADFVSSILSAFLFLTTRYQWGSHAVGNEYEVYLLFHRHRRPLAEWLYAANKAHLSTVFDAVVRVVTSSGTRVAPGANVFEWGYVAGKSCAAKFTRIDPELLQRRGYDKGQAALRMDVLRTMGPQTVLQDDVTTIFNGMQDVEINLHSIALTFKSSFLKALPDNIANNPDVRTVFDELLKQKKNLHLRQEAMQCAFVESAVHRTWVRLVGQDHDVQFWKTADPRMPIPSDSLRFYPDDMEVSEHWVVDLFEPIRKAFFTRSFFEPPILILLPEEKLTLDSSVAVLMAVCSASGRKLKEILVFRDYDMVQVYDVVSHGRRFYRLLVFTSNTPFTHHVIADQTVAGDATADNDHSQGQSAVIIRHPTHPTNRSRSAETFVPHRFLHGLIPDALLQTHLFWQDEDDNIRGYPTDDKAVHLLWLHWRELRFAPMGCFQTGAKLVRFADAKAAPRASEQAVLKSQKMNFSDELEDEIGMTRTDTFSGEDDDEAAAMAITAGMFRQSSVVYATKPDSAAIEDINLMLLDLMFARKGTPLHSLAQLLTRLDHLSNILVWTTQTDYDTNSGTPISLDLIALTRLKLAFRARLSPDGNGYALYSLDHAHLMVSNSRQGLVSELIQGVPHSIILSDANNSVCILVPRFELVRVGRGMFTTAVCVNRENSSWYADMDTKYYLYPVHVSLSFVFAPTLAASLYLLFMRLLNRNYAEVFRLVGSIGTDMSLTPEESQIFRAITNVTDQHPDCVACMCRLSLHVADSPVVVPWYIPLRVAQLLKLQSRLSVACLMPLEEERRLLHLASSIQEKLFLLEQTIAQNQPMRDFFSKSSNINDGMSKRGRSFGEVLKATLRDKLNYRATSDDLVRLLEKMKMYKGVMHMPEYAECLLHNRRLTIDVEFTSKQQGVSATAPVPLDLWVPKRGVDRRWLMFRDYDPRTITSTMPVKPFMNDGEKKLIPSNNWDYWYCGALQRTCKCKPQQCPSSAGNLCGGNSKDGCPCASCERFNSEHLHRIRLLPQSSIDNRQPSRAMNFMEVFNTIRAVMGAFSGRLQMQREHQLIGSGVSSMTYQSRYKKPSLRDRDMGFWFLYELLTRTKSCRVSKTECGRDFVQLLFPLYNDAQDVTSAMGHVIHFMAHSPACCDVAPRWPKKGKGPDLADAAEKVKEYATRHVATFPLPPDPSLLPRYASRVDQENAGRLSVAFSPRPTQRDATLALTRSLILPAPLNTGCSKRLVAIPDLDQLRLFGNERALLTVTAAQVEELIGVPLQSVVSAQFVVRRRRSELGLPLIPEELAFDLSRHPDATKTVARDMLARLIKESKVYAKSQNDTAVPKMLGLTSEAETKALVVGAVTDTRLVIQMQDRLTSLRAALLQLRSGDTEFVAYAQATVLRTANYVPTETVLGALMSLRAYARREATLTLDYLLSSLCSTTADHEWRQLNPFLTQATCDAVMALLVLTVLRTNRIGHINRALESITELDSLLAKVKKIEDASMKSLVDAVSASIQQKADSLASQLIVSRCYIDRSAAGNAFDPRFLIFEFTWNLGMRRRQYELVQDMHRAIARDESVVKQMIMGAGKTTVVSPMLALMLANGSNLVIQVVPPALLDFTRAVLRTTFSSVLPKQIFTFACDRTTEVDSDVLLKFEHATRCRGIVVTTPSSIKSIFLKYVEGLDRLVDPSRGISERATLEKEAHDNQKLLSMWRDSVLIMDEVDMLLHPLKSELNFPIGPKNDLDFTPLRWKLPIHLIDAVFYYHARRASTFVKESPEVSAILTRFSDTVKVGLSKNFLQEMPHLILLSHEFYDSDLKPVLIDWLLLFIKGQHFIGLSDGETASYMRQRPQQRDNPDLVQKIEGLDPSHIKLLNLSFEWINSYLPHVLQKIDRVTFGIMNNTDIKNARNDKPDMPQSRFVTSIPFVGKDMPSQSSEFAHPDIVIGLTVLAYRYEGLRDSDFDRIIGDVFAAVEKEVGRFSQRRTNLMYNKWVASSGGQLLTTFDYASQAPVHIQLADDEAGMQPSESYSAGDDPNGQDAALVSVLPLKLMRQANALELKKLFKLFRRTPEVIHWYLCEHIFPEHMRHQEVKLSASGQELGGNILFNRRIGFSGTPSSLLPVELGQCGYEMGTDGQLIHTLTSPSVMAHTVVEGGWTVRTLLDFVANAQPPFHALIDTGALITGMSNLQVAQYLLKIGLPAMEGVVFLDELDRKVILVRATGRVLRLAECGIPKVKRFAFYDQIHTTGMDIDHTPNAQAVQTLGKDMTFRDFSQGAYRMRGIGQGQTVHLLIIPEVYDLIAKMMFLVKQQQQPSSGAAAADATNPISAAAVGGRPRQHMVLTAVTAWLLINSIRSEHVQHNQLRVQSTSNVWRKEAYHRMKANPAGFSPLLPEPHPDALAALRVFMEPVNYTVTCKVPQPRLFSECLESHVVQHQQFITDEGRLVVQSIVDGARREDEIEAPIIDVEMVQEQEEEREREQEQDKQQEVEIEKYVEMDYNREEEAAVPWRLESLRSVDAAKQFYPLSAFHLYKRPSLAFPDSAMLSKNYYNPAWSGHRRIKNVIMTLEWIPSAVSLAERPQPSNDYNSIDRTAALQQLRQTIDMLTTHQQDSRSVQTMLDLLQTALHFSDPDHPRWAEVSAMLQRAMTAPPSDTAKLGGGSGGFSVADVAASVLEVLDSNLLREEQAGRYTVAVSLAEAETLRRILHHRKCRKQPLVPGADVAFALRMATCQNTVVDHSMAFPVAPRQYQVTKNFHALRYFDCEVQYTDAEVGLLLRAVHVNPQKSRQIFFQQIIGCRRRARQRWDRTPISLVFLMRDAFTLLHQRVVGLCIFREVQALELNLGDAFLAFNPSGTGALAPEEVWGAMRFCRLSLTCEDVLDFIDIADAQRDGTIQYGDFLYVLRGVREADDDNGAPTAEDQQGKKLPNVPPHGGHELKVARAARLLRLREEEEEAAKLLQDEERRVMQEIDQEMIRQEADVYSIFSNPKFSSATSSIGFEFGSATNVPQLVSTYRNYAVRNVPKAEPHTSVLLVNNAALRVSLRGLAHEVPTVSNKCFKDYVLTTEFKIPLCGRGKKKTLSALDHLSTGVEIASWSLLGHRFTRQNVATYETLLLSEMTTRQLAADEEAKLRKQQQRAQLKEEEATAAAAAASSGADDGPKASQSSSTEETEHSDNDRDDDDGWNGDADGDQNAQDGGDFLDTDEEIWIFKEPMPTVDNIFGKLRQSTDQNIMISAYDKRQTTVVNGYKYEWVRLADPRFPAGWVVAQGDDIHGTVLSPMRVTVSLGNDGTLKISTADDEKVSPPYGAIMDSSFDPDAQYRMSDMWGFAQDNLWHEEEEEEEDEDENDGAPDDDDGDDDPGRRPGRMRLGGDVEDLMFAIRRMRLLERGDKVKRHPIFWAHEEEDGGDGTIGTVHQILGDDTVEVLWPNKKKGTYSWGKAGVFELIKVDKSTIVNPPRDPENDEQRHKDDINKRVSHKMVCKQCQQRNFLMEDVFLCNTCQDFALCKDCFEEGYHDEHEFTEARAFISKKDSNKNKPDEEELDDYMDLLGMCGGDDTAAATGEKSAALSTEALASQALLAYFFPKEITDQMPGDVVTGAWVRCVNSCGPIRKHSIGFVFIVHGEKASVDFYVKAADRSTTRRPVPMADLVRVRPYADPATAAAAAQALYQPPISIEKCLKCQWSPALWLLADAAATRSKFQIGDCVSGRHANSEQVDVGTVMAVLPRTWPDAKDAEFGRHMYRVLFFNSNSATTVQATLPESTLEVCYANLSTVRIRNTVTYPKYGWLSAVPASKRYRTVFTVDSHSVPNGTEIAINCSTAQGQRKEMAPADVEPVRPATWVSFQGDGAAAGYTVLPRSCEIIIDRVHTEGGRRVRFGVGKKHYRAEFPAYELFLESLDGDTPVGRLARFPPKLWSKPQKPKSFDDGFWHVLSLIVSGNSIKALCDGEFIPAVFESGSAEKDILANRNNDDFGHVKREKKVKKRVAAMVTTQASTAAVPKSKPPEPVEDSMFDIGMDLFGSNVDDGIEDEAEAVPEAAPEPAVPATDAASVPKLEDATTPVAPAAPEAAPAVAAAVTPETAAAVAATAITAPEPEPEPAAATRAAPEEASAEPVAVAEAAEDEDEEEEEAAEQLKPMGDFIPLCIANPLLVFASLEGASSSGEDVEDTFPRRYMAWLDVKWSDAVDAASVQAWHRAIAQTHMWQCFTCQATNPRTVARCEECAEPRQLLADHRLDCRNDAKFRAVLLYSKEASHLRSKLNNKLRALFQAQLDGLMNPVDAL